MRKVKGPVTLRCKKLVNGSESLYLDIYWNGKRHYEFLKMYLNPISNDSETTKRLNSNILKAANSIAAQRTQELILGKAGLTTNHKDISIDDWMIRCQNDATELARSKHRENDQNAKSIKQTRAILHLFCKQYNKQQKVIYLSEIDKDFIIHFCQWMTTFESSKTKKLLSANTIHFYFTILSTAINKAFKRGLISMNPIHQLEEKDKPHKVKNKREYLTLEEVSLLYHQPGNTKITRAFLFSCLSGLRLSDIATLKWKHLKCIDKQWIIEKRQIKTQEILYLPISQDAYRLLPTRTDDEGLIFPIRIDNGYTSKYISRWVNQAGIHKHITFHCARHTFATILLSQGADLYTTSKLLGHKDITTTQIYANVMNNKKKDTMNLFNGIFSRTLR